MTNYEAGRAKGREEGAQAVLAMSKKLADMTADRDEWKRQHENLVEVRRRDIESLKAKIDRLSEQQTKPPHEREGPHCSTCACGMPVTPRTEPIVETLPTGIHTIFPEAKS